VSRLLRWLDDWAWAARVRRARRARRGLSFSGRARFDAALRPRLRQEPGLVVAYPDAFYHVRDEDLSCAEKAAAEHRERTADEEHQARPDSGRRGGHAR
jgi:hypothetical protein